jgi:segregation and condensation protein A
MGNAIIPFVQTSFLDSGSEGYQIFTDVYEGPLDLLLDLIERAELDITTLALAQVTDQYLAYMHEMQDRNIAEVSSFLVIASKLLQIKSAALLPRPETVISGSEEEDVGEALARQLILYKRFKELGQVLETRASAGLRTFLHVAPIPKFPTKFDLSGVTLQDLVTVAREVFIFNLKMKPLSEVVSLPRVTIRERIRFILTKIKEMGATTFRSLFAAKSTRVELVVTFLAMLELIKQRIISVQQNELFGEINMAPVGAMNENPEIEIEFED